MITRRSVAALNPSAMEYVLWDSSLKGFGVRVTPAGTKTYLFQYRPPHTEQKRTIPPRKVTLGRHGLLTPEMARARAAELAVMVAQGVDPVAAAQDERRCREREAAAAAAAQEKAQKLTLRALSGRFLKFIKTTSPASYEFCEGTLRLHVLPSIGAVRLDELTRSHVNQALSTLELRQTALRRNVFAVLSWLSAWAVEDLDLLANPMASMKPPPAAEARDRVLSDEELRWLWQASTMLPSPYPAFYRTLVLTGQRREEVAGLRWEEVNRNAREWTLPGERAKNGESNIIPLSRQMVSLFDGLAGSAEWPRSGVVFPSRAKTSLSAFSQGKRLLDAAMLQAAKAAQAGNVAIPPWRVHDIRRTVATGLQRLGVRFEVTEAVLNHLSGSRSGIAGVYQRYGWAAEKRAALEAWACYVTDRSNPEKA
nr:site-specific integrase [Sphingobium sp. SYK-6]